MIASIRALGPGALAGLVLAALAWAATRGTPVPTLLAALLVGMGARVVLDRASFRPGVALLAKPLLRFGVALMGFRITLADLNSLGWEPALIALVATGATLACGYGLARLIGLERPVAILTASAVAICGASAALAVAAVLMRGPREQVQTVDRHTVATVASITLIGTGAILLHPAIAHMLGWSPLQGAVFLGASIHEVAQVVAASDVWNPDVTAEATTVKMIRVALLPLLCLALAAWVSRQAPDPDTDAQAAPVPLFLVGFLAAIIVANTGLVPQVVTAGAVQLSILCLTISMVALGAQTSVAGLMSLGPRPLLALLAQSVVIALVAGLGVALLTPGPAGP